MAERSYAMSLVLIQMEKYSFLIVPLEECTPHNSPPTLNTFGLTPSVNQLNEAVYDVEEFCVFPYVKGHVRVNELQYDNSDLYLLPILDNDINTLRKLRQYKNTKHNMRTDIEKTTISSLKSEENMANCDVQEREIENESEMANVEELKKKKIDDISKRKEEDEQEVIQNENSFNHGNEAELIEDAPTQRSEIARSFVNKKENYLLNKIKGLKKVDKKLNGKGVSNDMKKTNKPYTQSINSARVVKEVLNREMNSDVLTPESSQRSSSRQSMLPNIKPQKKSKFFFKRKKSSPSLFDPSSNGIIYKNRKATNVI